MPYWHGQRGAGFAITPRYRGEVAARLHAALALLPAGAAIAWWFELAPDSAGTGLSMAFLVAVPLMVSRDVFAKACLVVAVTVTAVSVLGALLGLFVFLPCGFILLMAGLAARASRIRAAAFIAACLATAGTLAAWGVNFYQQAAAA